MREGLRERRCRRGETAPPWGVRIRNRAADGAASAAYSLRSATAPSLGASAARAGGGGGAATCAARG